MYICPRRLTTVVLPVPGLPTNTECRLIESVSLNPRSFLILIKLRGVYVGCAIAQPIDYDVMASLGKGFSIRELGGLEGRVEGNAEFDAFALGEAA